MSISQISGKELVARGAVELGSALALTAGTEAPAGGDAGPSSAVPSFWGLHEFDAFLLVVDGVPWGGAYNPSITTLDLNDVERLEVLKGAAPVMYGATSFVGVIHAIHYPAGQSADEVSMAYGNYGSTRASIATALPSAGGIRQSLALDVSDIGFANAREEVSAGHLLYRGAVQIGTGTMTLDFNATRTHDVPDSPVLRAGEGLTALTPPNANFNPANARIDEHQYQLALGYTVPTAYGEWATLASYSYSDVTDIRGFLHPDLSGTADTQWQSRYIQDAYLDTHLSHRWSDRSSVVVGVDLLYGHGTQTTLNGNDAYTVPLDGSVVPPPTRLGDVNEIGTLEDTRLFLGQYAQWNWTPGSRWDLIVGVRLNEASEHKLSSDLTLPPPQYASASARRTMNRVSDTLGASYHAWQQGEDSLTVFADLRSAFKPAAIDFGPDYTPDLLSPETALSYELGLKGALLNRRLEYQASLFRLDFRDLVVPTQSGALANAGGERLRGLEVEGRYDVGEGVELRAAASYHDATYTKYLVTDGDSAVDVAGRELMLSPHLLASVGLLYNPKKGLGMNLVARLVGPRYLDEENTARVGGYLSLDANLTAAWDHFRVTLEGTNLTNQRPPVTASEFGSASFYLLPGRMTWLRLAYALH